MSGHRVWVRSAAEGQRYRYRYRAACTCGWVGPVRVGRRDCLPDRSAHEAEHPPDLPPIPGLYRDADGRPLGFPHRKDHR